MHPAKSVIFFTTTTGAGYGLLVCLFFYSILGDVASHNRFYFAGFGAAFGLIIAGLMASTFHLGHPERAWRALSQWRTSWLSREGVVALFTFLPAVLFAASWWFLGMKAGLTIFLGGMTAVFSVATIWCTGMIYASLKAIPAWNNPWTVPGYLSLAAATGVPLFLTLAQVAGGSPPWMPYLAAIGFVFFAFIIKSLYWVFKKYDDVTATAESATGLKMGKVSLLEAPHDAANYLMKEMGFRIARKHASVLRKWCMFLGFILPIAFLVMAVTSPPQNRFMPTLFAFAFVFTGTLIERWLFFAEAKHVVTLYYGEEQV